MPENESGARLARLSEGRNTRSSSSSLSIPRPYYGGGISTSSRYKIGAGVLLVIIGAAGSITAALIGGTWIIASIPALIGVLLISFKLTAKHTYSYSIERLAVHCTTVVGLLGALTALSAVVYSLVLLFRGGGWEPVVLLTGAVLTLLVCGIFCLRFIRDEY